MELTPVISSEDIVMSTATLLGTTVGTIHARGFGSMADVLNAIREACGPVAGLVQLSVRNASRGWSQRRAMFIKPCGSSHPFSLSALGLRP